MKNLYLALIAVTLVFCSFSIKAQDEEKEDFEVSIPVANFNDMISKQESLKQEIFNLKKDIEKKNDSISILNVEIIKLNSALSELKKNEGQKNQEIDRLNRLLNEQKLQLGEMDMVRVRYANGRLDLPYNEKKIEEALNLYNNISDPEIKEKYNVIIVLLNSYAQHRQDVEDILMSLQNNKSRTIRTEFVEWKEMAMKELKNNNYYKFKRNQKTGSIRYLDRIIEITEKRLENAKRPENPNEPYVDFSDLLDLVRAS